MSRRRSNLVPDQVSSLEGDFLPVVLKSGRIKIPTKKFEIVPPVVKRRRLKDTILQVESATKKNPTIEQKSRPAENFNIKAEAVEPKVPIPQDGPPTLDLFGGNSFQKPTNIELNKKKPTQVIITAKPCQPWALPSADHGYPQSASKKTAVNTVQTSNDDSYPENGHSDNFLYQQNVKEEMLLEEEPLSAQNEFLSNFLNEHGRKIDFVKSEASSLDDEPGTSDSLLNNTQEDQTNIFVNDRDKFIMSVGELKELFKVCFRPSCGQKITANFTHKDGLLKVKWSCTSGHEGIWYSQPLVNGDPLGAIELSTAIVVTGNVYERIAELAKSLNLKIHSKAAHVRYLKRGI